MLVKGYCSKNDEITSISCGITHLDDLSLENLMLIGNEIVIEDCLIYQLDRPG